MIDLHCHLLYDLDDGPRKREISVNMARQAHAAGVRTVVCTPHSPESSASRHYSPQLIAERAHEVQELAAAAGYEITLKPGTEISYIAHARQRLDRKELLTLGGSRTVLIEMPVFAVDMRFLPTAVELIANGYQVILAHPERYIYNQKDVDDLRRIHESGVLFQVTAAAVEETNSRTLFDLQMVDVVASDAHSDTYRVTAMDTAFEWVSNAYGAGLAHRLFVDTPQRLLNQQ